MRLPAGAVTPAINDITGDFLYTWTECAWPSLSPTCQDEYLHIVFQGDDYAGAYVQTPTQGQGSVTENSLIYLKHFVGVPWGIDDQKGSPGKLISLNGIYPNPASDIITLNFDRISNENVTLKIYNAIGSIVKKEMFVQNQQKIIIGDLCYGIYIVEIKSKELIEKQKLIIQR